MSTDLFEPFAFKGHPDNPVYLHPPCGTVVDVSPLNRDAAAAVAEGECDCETSAAWRRVYVRQGGDE